MKKNYSLKSCLGDNKKIIIATTDKNVFSPGDIVPINEDGIIFCCEVISETLEDSTAEIIGNPTNCLQCLIDNNINFIFTDCTYKKEPIPTYVISPTYFSYLPTINKFYYTTLQGQKNSICLQLQGISSQQPSDSIPEDLPIESDSCEKCDQPSFNYLIIERNNRPEFQQKRELYNNSYNEYINNRTVSGPK